MATDIRTTRAIPERATLRGVDWPTYLGLRAEPRNDHLRMSYLDGVLVLLSPQYIHDRQGCRLAVVVSEVTEALQIPAQATVSSTLSRQGPGPRWGSGKEPDFGYYFRENEARMREKKVIDLSIDPPPDLAIEIDNKANPSRALKIYARIGVPELWRYRVKTKSLWFGRLVGETSETIDRSHNLPRLTPELVLHALGQVDRLGETAWKPWLRDWARDLPEVPKTA